MTKSVLIATAIVLFVVGAMVAGSRAVDRWQASNAIAASKVSQ